MLVKGTTGGGITYYINQRIIVMRPFLLYMSYSLFDEFDRVNIRHTLSCQLTFSEVLRYSSGDP